MHKAYLSAITVTNISQIFTYKMAAKIDWHRYGTKLRKCHPSHTNRLLGIRDDIRDVQRCRDRRQQ